MTRLAYFIQMYRRAKNVSLRDLAQEMKLPLSVLHGIESGKKPVSFKVLIRIYYWMMRETSVPEPVVKRSSAIFVE